MRKIATVKLARGNVGFYDKLTRIYLTISHPIAEVFSGMNLTNLRNGVKFKTIEVIEGSLYGDVIIEEPVVEEKDVVEENLDKKVEEKPIKEEKAVVEETVVEEKKVVEEKPKKTSTRKTRTKKSSSTEEEK